MPRKATGTIYFSCGHWYARVLLDKPKSYQLPDGFDEPQAEARKAILADLALALRKEPSVAVDLADKVLARVAGAAAADLPVVRRWAEGIARGEKKPAAPPGEIVTFGKLAEQWTTGELARRFPDRIAAKSSAPADISRLNNHILPVVVGADGIVVRDLPVSAFELDHGEAILSALPAHLGQGTRCHVAQILSRLLAMAAYPLRLIPASPLPKGWVPPAGPRKALGWLYPAEDRQLMACTAVPLRRRLLWGFLDREGCRISEARRLELPELDLRQGVLVLDVNKTKDPRAWALTPGVPEALAMWLELEGITEGPVFPERDGEHKAPQDLAELFRSDLLLAGVTRPELHEKTAVRLKIRVHDLRGTFVTLSGANGRSEAWIMDRTGHGTSAMLNRYRRATRLAAELHLGELDRLDLALPEIRDAIARKQAAAEASAEGIVGGIVGAARQARGASGDSRLASAPAHGDDIHEIRVATAPIRANAGADPTRIDPNGGSRRGSPDASPTIPDDSANPRLRLFVAACRALLDAGLGGDLGVAREAHATIGRLIADGKSVAEGEVLELRDRRRRPEVPEQLELPLAAAAGAASSSPSPPPSIPSTATPSISTPKGPGPKKARPSPPPEVEEGEQLVAGGEQGGRR